MVKAEIRSLIKNLLPKHDKVGKYHSLILDAAIETVINELYHEVFADNPLTLQRFTKPYGYTVPLVVNYEASSGLYYTTLPANIVVLPDKASGVRRVSSPLQGGMSFFPMDAREHDLILSGSYANTVTSKVGYCVTPTRVEFYKANAATLTNGVRMDLIVPFSVYADTDQVVIPEIGDLSSSNPYKQKNAQTLVQRVLAILGVIGSVDQLDNNSDPVQRQNSNN